MFVSHIPRHALARFQWQILHQDIDVWLRQENRLVLSYKEIVRRELVHCVCFEKNIHVVNLNCPKNRCIFNKC